MTENETVETIDLTPTWEGILPGFIDIIETMAAKSVLSREQWQARETAYKELRKMARLADAYVRIRKTADDGTLLAEAARLSRT